MNVPAELRRQYHAARHLERLEAKRRALDERTARANATLAAALAMTGGEQTTVPGYAVTRTPHGIQVAPVEPVDADQLALWRELARREEN